MKTLRFRSYCRVLTASPPTGALSGGLTGSGLFRLKWLRFSLALTQCQTRQTLWAHGFYCRIRSTAICRNTFGYLLTRLFVTRSSFHCQVLQSGVSHFRGSLHALRRLTTLLKVIVPQAFRPLAAGPTLWVCTRGFPEANSACSRPWATVCFLVQRAGA